MAAEHWRSAPKSSQLRLWFLGFLMLPLLSGCVAALLPLAALGTIGKGEIDRAKAKREIVAAGAVEVRPKVATVTIVPDAVPKQIEPDYAGQGGALEEVDGVMGIVPESDFTSPFADFTRYSLAQSAKLEAGEGISSAVLVPNVSLENPETMECARKPLAVLIDLDDEVDRDWIQADTLYHQRGLREALVQLRQAKISVIWVSDEPVIHAEKLAGILSEAGLSAKEADDFLFLNKGGDDRKQARRWYAARNYCIVAMIGDKKSDFDELYDYLLRPEAAASLNSMFGVGWFITPPPLVAKPENIDGVDADAASDALKDEG